MLNRITLIKGFKSAGFILSALFIMTFAISCSQEKQQEKEPELKFHEVKEFVIKYDLSGARSGQKTIYSQDWGRCVTQVTENLKMVSLMEDGEQYVVSIDLTNNTGKKMKNPIYQQLMETLNAKTPKEFNAALLEKMGAKEVGEKNVAGNNCTEWEMMEGAQKTCITEDGIVLESSSNISGAQIGEIAFELKRGTTDGVDACSTGDAVIEEIEIQEMIPQKGTDQAPQLEFKEKE